MVFGEDPYAEFQGDRPTVAYKPGDTRDLLLLRRLKDQGVPVVAVFLSGRPLWVNPYINASDAFVAAWLPGSEGAGVADVLIGDQQGLPRNDFRGRLSYSWPRRSDQTPLNRGDPGYDPLFPYGFGLTYRDKGDLAPLSEDGGPSQQSASVDVYFAGGRVPDPWVMTLGDSKGEAPVAGAVATSPGGALSLRAIDAGAQEDGRMLVWTGAGRAEVRIAGAAIDLSRQTTGDMALSLRLRVDEPPSAPVELSVGCGERCGGGVDLQSLLAGSQRGQWRTVKIKLACFRQAGADMSRISTPIVLTTAGRLSLGIADVRLATNQGEAICR